MTGQPCRDCGQALKYREGRTCPACRQHRQRRGLTVTDVLAVTRLGTPPVAAPALRDRCRVCRRKALHARGYCKPCYDYWARHQRSRPRRPVQPHHPQLAACRVCAWPTVIARSLCTACYAYWRRHRADRPIIAAFTCTACARAGQHWGRGLCRRCFNREFMRVWRQRRREVAA